MSDLVSNSLLTWINDSNLKVIFTSLILLIIITIVAIGIDYLISKTLIFNLNNKLKISKNVLLKQIEQHKVLNALGLLVIGLVFVYGSFLLVQPEQQLSITITNIVLKSANLFNLYILTLSLNRFFFALHDYTNSTK